jgi:hypothetical protein
VEGSWEYINRSQTHDGGKLDMRPRNSFSGNTQMGFSLPNGESKVASRLVHHQQTDGGIKTKHSLIGAEELSRHSTYS